MARTSTSIPSQVICREFLRLLDREPRYCKITNTFDESRQWSTEFELPDNDFRSSLDQFPDQFIIPAAMCMAREINRFFENLPDIRKSVLTDFWGACKCSDIVQGHNE
jgi:hypothetical protein